MMTVPENTESSTEREKYIIRSEIDEFTTPVKVNSKLVPQYDFFVNNLLTTGPQMINNNGCNNPKLVASSIENSYILIGNLGPIQKPILLPTMFWDKI